MLTGSTGGDVTGNLVKVLNYGCNDTDYTSINFQAGDLALVIRTPITGVNNCGFVDKVFKAQEHNASAILIYNDGIGDGRVAVFTGGMGGAISSIPALTLSFIVGDQLSCLMGSATPQPVSIRVFASFVKETVVTANVLAQTKHGDPRNVIQIGGHLDSVEAGPGINDDGSGSATVLELAILVATKKVDLENAIRFSWWGAEELGLLGSRFYINNITGFPDEKNKLAAYLNFDMIGSPNYQRGILNGSSAQGAGLPGCTTIQNLFQEDLTKQNLTWEVTGFGPPYRSDYGPFVEVGIPGGGLFTGAEQLKPMDGRTAFGGISGVAYDPCYHLFCDTIENINQEVLEQFAQSAARILQRLAEEENVRAFLGSNTPTDSGPYPPLGDHVTNLSFETK